METDPSPPQANTDITERKEIEEILARRAQHAALRADVSTALNERGTLPTILQR